MTLSRGDEHPSRPVDDPDGDPAGESPAPWLDGQARSINDLFSALENWRGDVRCRRVLRFGWLRDWLLRLWWALHIDRDTLVCLLVAAAFALGLYFKFTRFR